jgi:hypothetical protein
LLAKLFSLLRLYQAAIVASSKRRFVVSGKGKWKAKQISIREFRKWPRIRHQDCEFF